MTKQESKLTLEELLNSMTTLDKSEYTPEERAAIANSEQVSYDEFLSHDLAKAILGKDYDPECSYKLLTEVAQTTVLKIDPRIPENEEPVTDDNGVIIRAHIMEYTLQESSPDSYKVDLESEENVTREWFNIEKDRPRTHKMLDWRLVFGLCFVLLFIVWNVTLFYLLQFKAAL